MTQKDTTTMLPVYLTPEEIRQLAAAAWIACTLAKNDRLPDQYEGLEETLAPITHMLKQLYEYSQELMPMCRHCGIYQVEAKRPKQGLCRACKVYQYRKGILPTESTMAKRKKIRRGESTHDDLMNHVVKLPLNEDKV